MNRCLLLAFALAAAGCATPSQPATDPTRIRTTIEAPMGSEFDLHVGEGVTISGTNLRLRLDSVTNDSRCPVEVQCVWAGNAVAYFTDNPPVSGAVSLPDLKEYLEFSLNTGIEPRTKNLVDKFDITLVGLKPAARKGGISQKDYISVLKVTAH